MKQILFVFIFLFTLFIDQTAANAKSSYVVYRKNGCRAQMTPSPSPRVVTRTPTKASQDPLIQLTEDLKFQRKNKKAILESIEQIRTLLSNQKFLLGFDENKRQEILNLWEVSIQNISELKQKTPWTSDQDDYFQQLLRTAVTFLTQHFLVLGKSPHPADLDLPHMRTLLEALSQAQGHEATWHLYRFKRAIENKVSLLEFNNCHNK